MTLGVTTRKGQKGTFWCNGNVLYFGLGDGNWSVHICQNSWNQTPKICAFYYIKVFQ